MLTGEETLAQNKAINLVVFASGRGSNAKNILEYVASNKNKESFRLNVLALVTDQKNAGVIEYARQFNTPIHVIPFKTSKKDHEDEVLDKLKDHPVDYICLCGYMRILSPLFINAFTHTGEKHSRIINIHPSLLPDFPGKDGYGDAFKANVKESGVTLHFVDEGIDTGKIIKQRRFARYEDDDFESFQKRGLKLEHESYRELLQELNDNGVVIYE